jgi:hypothetical protein
MKRDDIVFPDLKNRADLSDEEWEIYQELVADPKRAARLDKQYSALLDIRTLLSSCIDDQFTDDIEEVRELAQEAINRINETLKIYDCT